MINQTILQGRLVANPELKHTQSGIPVATFRIAWSEKHNENETKLFLPCVAWRSAGEFVHKYFHKGQEIAVEGQLSTRTWTDKDGNSRASIELTVDKAHFCGPKDPGGGNYAPPRSDAPAPSSYDSNHNSTFRELAGDDDELPF